MAPRGIVAASASAIFALYLQNSAEVRVGAEQAQLLVAVTFTVIIGTVTIYGLTAPLAARRLGLAEAEPRGVVIVGSALPAQAIAHALYAQGVEVLLLDDHRTQINTARLQGLPAHVASVPSERLLEEMDLTGMGQLLALSPHEAINVLAVPRFRDRFGRVHVYQLPPEHELGKGKHTARDLPARPLFSWEMTYHTLEQHLLSGAALKATRLTESFTYQDYQAHQDGNAVPFFLLLPDGQLRVVVAGQAIAPQPGQTVISLVFPSA
jgi:CPA1 family monovalent cation:H+ antiporter